MSEECVVLCLRKVCDNEVQWCAMVGNEGQ